MGRSSRILFVFAIVGGVVALAYLGGCTAGGPVGQRGRVERTIEERHSGVLGSQVTPFKVPQQSFEGFDRFVFGDSFIDLPRTGKEAVLSEREGAEATRDLAALSADELWVVERPDAVPVPEDPNAPRTGSMVAKQESVEVPLPLKHTEVKAEISGYIGTVEVTQQFHNPFNEKIEAVYVFPLPTDAAVNDFLMIIGERKIRGIIREREEAQRIYAEARRQGYVASLLTQERPNIFTQSVANIEPRRQIDVTIKYFHTLAYVDGSYEFVFPMVVGPRFNPPGSTDGVGAVGRGDHGISGQSTEVQYLRPGERSGHDIGLQVYIDAGVAIEDIASVNHAIEKQVASPERAIVKLSPRDAIPNKDFVLRYKVAGATIKSSLLVHRDKRGGFFTFMLYPPEDLAVLPAAPVEFIFVIDCSGSMSEQPIAKAKAAAEHAIRKLTAGDTFQIIRFANGASQFAAAPVPATEANVENGLSFLRNLDAGGGTMMIEWVKAAFDHPQDEERLRIVSVMTDGYVGNEGEIFAAIQKRLGAARIFSFGVGSSVNRYLLEGIARIGKGAVAYVALGEDGGRAVDLFYEKVRHAALTDIAIRGEGIEISDVFPSRVPDLFVGRPVIVTGRFSGAGNGALRVAGRMAGRPKEMVIAAAPGGEGGEASQHPGIPLIWARKQIEVLSDLALVEGEGSRAPAIRELALEYNLVSAYTAFVAVDSSARTAGDHGTIVPVAVPVPDGVRYDTTVQEGQPTKSGETSG